MQINGWFVPENGHVNFSDLKRCLMLKDEQ
jgi:hypothetical protein